jgi:hypothetical protein
MLDAAERAGPVSGSRSRLPPRLVGSRHAFFIAAGIGRARQPRTIRDVVLPLATFATS